VSFGPALNPPARIVDDRPMTAWIVLIAIVAVAGAVTVTYTKRAARDLRRRGHRAAVSLAWAIGIVLGVFVFARQL
jgi:hypothetical protein